MDIYDLEKDYQKICTVEAGNPSVCEWSPDGKHILTATTSPRLRVDNGVRIWHVDGGLMYNEDLQELYYVAWRPQPTTDYALGNPLAQIPTPHASALAYLGTVKTPSKPAGAYRPPGARGTPTPLAFMSEAHGGAAYVSNGSVNGYSKPRKREVPGAEAAIEDSSQSAPAAEGDEYLSKAAVKNKKKREAKKAKEAAEKAAGLTPAADTSVVADLSAPGRSSERRERSSHERNRSRTDSEIRPRSQQGRREQKEKPKPGPQKVRSAPNGTAGPSKSPSAPAKSISNPAPDLTVTSPGGGTPQEKKIRALTKKLRAIDDLKMRLAGGEILEATQIKKMDTEESVRRELDALGWSE